MTTVTWTAAAPTTPAFKPALAPALKIAKKIRHFLAVGFGVYAETDSNYRGLDLNGNAVWAKPAQH